MHTAGNAPRPTRPPATTVTLPRTLLLATDLQQSILAELDRSGPNLRTYTAYGSPSSLRPMNAGLGFNGQLKERPTGWYHLGNGHRVYNPVLMRFHSPDRLSPFGEGGINAYAYCKGDPLNYTDPTGQFIDPIIQLGQRSLLVTLHTAAPVAIFFGPKVQGVAKQATRFALLGSVGTAAGAAMSAAGSPYGLYVITGGTLALVAGAATRGVMAVKDAYQKSELLKTFTGNARNIFGFSASTKVAKPAAPSTVIDIETPSLSPSSAPHIDAPVSPTVEAVDIRRPTTG